jgi:hypothetical protein
VPAPNNSICSSGNPLLTWLQLLMVELGSQIFLSSAVVRQFAQSFSGFTTTAIPSLATCASPYSMPSFWQALTSSGSIGRDASEMSVSPAQNFSNPPPVPEMPTVILTSGFSSRNSSAAASVSGPTVLDPSTLMEPDRFPALALSSPHALAIRGSDSNRSAVGNSMRERTRALLLSFDSFIRNQSPRPRGSRWLKRRVCDVKML